MSKSHRKQRGRFVQIHEWMQQSEAWATMKPGPRALYVELKRRYSGAESAEVALSHRDAAKALNANKSTVGRYFQVLVERGFIALTRGHHLGPEGVGQSDRYRLTELRHNGASVTKEFMHWRAPENLRSRRQNADTPSAKNGQGVRKSQLSKTHKTQNADSLPPNQPVDRPQNPDISNLPCAPSEAQQSETSPQVIGMGCPTAWKLRTLRAGRLNLTENAKLKLVAGLDLEAGRKALAKAKLPTSPEATFHTNRNKGIAGTERTSALRKMPSRITLTG